jgi:hypothetical protein
MMMMIGLKKDDRPPKNKIRDLIRPQRCVRRRRRSLPAPPVRAARASAQRGEGGGRNGGECGGGGGGAGRKKSDRPMDEKELEFYFRERCWFKNHKLHTHTRSHTLLDQKKHGVNSFWEIHCVMCYDDMQAQNQKKKSHNYIFLGESGSVLDQKKVRIYISFLKKKQNMQRTRTRKRGKIIHRMPCQEHSNQKLA